MRLASAFDEMYLFLETVYCRFPTIAQFYDNEYSILPYIYECYDGCVPYYRTMYCIYDPLMHSMVLAAVRAIIIICGWLAVVAYD